MDITILSLLVGFLISSFAFYVVLHMLCLGLYDSIKNKSYHYKQHVIPNLVLHCFIFFLFYWYINNVFIINNNELKYFSELPRLTMEEKKFIDNLEKKYGVDVELMLKK